MDCEEHLLIFVVQCGVEFRMIYLTEHFGEYLGTRRAMGNVHRSQSRPCNPRGEVGRQWCDESGGYGLVSDAHVVDADSLPWVSTVAVRVGHAANPDWGWDGGGNRAGWWSDADVTAVADFSVLAVGVGHAANFDGGGGAGWSWGRSSDAEVVFIADLTFGAVGIGHATEFDGSGRGSGHRRTAGGGCDTNVVLTDLSVGTVSIDFTSELDRRSGWGWRWRRRDDGRGRRRRRSGDR